MRAARLAAFASLCSRRAPRRFSPLHPRSMALSFSFRSFVAALRCLAAAAASASLFRLRPRVLEEDCDNREGVDVVAVVVLIGVVGVGRVQGAPCKT